MFHAKGVYSHTVGISFILNNDPLHLSRTGHDEEEQVWTHKGRRKKKRKHELHWWHEYHVLNKLHWHSFNLHKFISIIQGGCEGTGWHYAVETVLALQLLMTPGGALWVMSDWLFDEQRGNSVSRHAVTQRNSSGCSPQQGLSVIKVDLECEVREWERERRSDLCQKTAVENTKVNRWRSTNGDFIFFFITDSYWKGMAWATDQASRCGIDRLGVINGREMLVGLVDQSVSLNADTNRKLAEPLTLRTDLPHVHVNSGQWWMGDRSFDLRMAKRTSEICSSLLKVNNNSQGYGWPCLVTCIQADVAASQLQGPWRNPKLGLLHVLSFTCPCGFPLGSLVSSHVLSSYTLLMTCLNYSYTVYSQYIDHIKKK